MNIEGTIIRLRAVEPDDADLLYAWENDCALWAVSGTTEPFSREQMARFVERQLGGGDLLHTGQLRLMIDTKPTLLSSEKPRTVGTIDLFDYDPVARRAGIGILVYGADDRGRGYASDAVETLCRYAREVLDLHQLWCGGCPQRSEPVPLPPYRLRRVRHPARLAPHARRLRGRGDAATHPLTRSACLHRVFPPIRSLRSSPSRHIPAQTNDSRSLRPGSRSSNASVAAAAPFTPVAAIRRRSPRRRPPARGRTWLRNAPSPWR